MMLLIQYTLIFASVLVLVALGGCISEHSGVINLGLEGIMVIGALGGALMMKYLPAGSSAFVTIVLTVLMAILAGVIYSSLLAVSCINFKADQTIVGTALNMLGVAAATVIVKALNSAENPDNPSSEISYIAQKKAFLVNINGFEFNWFMVLAVLALIFVAVMLYKTAASVGISVYKMRWAGVLLSGALGGLGGLVYITAGVSQWKFENGVAGFGFLSLAVMIFGQWKPKHIAWAAVLFGIGRNVVGLYHVVFQDDVEGGILRHVDGLLVFLKGSLSHVHDVLPVGQRQDFCLAVGHCEIELHSIGNAHQLQLHPLRLQNAVGCDVEHNMRKGFLLHIHIHGDHLALGCFVDSLHAHGVQTSSNILKSIRVILCSAHLIAIEIDVEHLVGVGGGFHLR